jgi:hypothetical protein
MKILNFIKKYFLIIVNAISKFLHWSFAPEVTIGALAVIIYLHGHHFWAFILIAWGILLTINEYNHRS